jgi:hypothetical protein
MQPSMRSPARKALLEQRKCPLVRELRRNHTRVIEAIYPKYKGLVKRNVHNPSSIDHEQYDKLVAQLMQEDKDENDNDFEPEKEEESTSGESDDALPGPGFVRLRGRKSRVDENDFRNLVARLSVIAEAMDTTEMATSQAMSGGAFTEEADQYFAFPVHAEFAEADLTSFEENCS